MTTFLRRLSATLLLSAVLLSGTAGVAHAGTRHDGDRGCQPLPTVCQGGDAPGFARLGQHAGGLLGGIVR